MDLKVLAVPDCPNAVLLEQRLAQVLQDRPDVTVSRQVIADQDEAARQGMHGSPTILVDGKDPLGRGGRGRVAPAERGMRTVHQAVLRSFAATGRAPEQGVLDEAAAPFDARQVVAELAEDDFLCLDQTGRISAAYPFSAAATPHTIRITGGASAYAMCAIDALGMAEMLHTSVLIRSADPSDGEPVTVTLDRRGAVWHPATAVVFVGRTADQRAGPSAETCCEHVNFFASRRAAEAWASAHPEVTGGILSQARARQVAEQIFGQLLRLPGQDRPERTAGRLRIGPVPRGQDSAAPQPCAMTCGTLPRLPGG